MPHLRNLPIAASDADFFLSVAMRDEPEGLLPGGPLGVLDDLRRNG